MPYKILIVDDDLDTLRLIGLMLQRQGYLTTASSSGLQALEIVKDEKPDLIILDIMIPDLDGYEIARRLRSSPETASIPIIMFTAKSLLDDKISGFDAGADAYLTKPTQPRELFAHVREVLARYDQEVPGFVASHPEKGTVTGLMAVKGGLGISTLAINLGIAIRNKTKRETIVAEFRPGEGSMALDLGLPLPEGLNRLLQKPGGEITAVEVEKELVGHASGLRLLPASYFPRDARYNQAIDGFEGVIRQLPHLASSSIVDLGPSLPSKTEKVISYCDNLIILIEPVSHTIIRTRALLDDLEEMGFETSRISAVLITQFWSNLQLTWSQVQDQLEHQLAVAFTPAPEAYYQAAKNKVPLLIQQPGSLAAQQFNKLADNVLRQERLRV
jgi:DNA-binding response OmpR family regulator